MTFDPDLISRADRSVPLEHESVHIPAGRMVSLRFLRLALHRRRKLWLGLAVLGLVVGVAYHVAVPVQYSATSTLYLAHPSGTNETVGSANDLAMLDTSGVANAAIKQLHEPGLTMAKLFGKVPGKVVSDNILSITISGSSPQEAVRRVNAVTTAYLAFRNAQYNGQNEAVVGAADKQIAKLQATISSLTTKINALGSAAGGEQGTALIAQRTAATAQIANLQQAIQQDNLTALSVSQGSRVITAGTANHTSKTKVLVLDGLTGLVVGLALGIGIVVLQAVLSDRLRRREDIAAILGVSVDVSIGRIGRKRFFRRSARALARSQDPGLLRLAEYLGDRLDAGGPKPTELVVAIDDVDVPAAAVASLAAKLSRAGRRVCLVDATATRVLGRAVGAGSPRGSQQVPLSGGAEITLVTPRQPWEPDQDGRWEYDLADVANADAIVVVATVKPTVGAWHLRAWANDAILTVSAGRSTVQEINTVAELLDAADITAASAVLLDADTDDESVGLPEPGAVAFGRRQRLDLVHAAVSRPLPLPTT
jgi:capsular polysaccharide biosynthesis protein